MTGREWQRSSIYHTYSLAHQHCYFLSLDGKDDWRLPTLTELISIVDYNDTTVPLINSSAFPDPPTHEYGEYWSATNSTTQSSTMFTVSFHYGDLRRGDRTESYDTRCVRSYGMYGPILQDNGDGTVTDHATGLIWQQGVEEAETFAYPWADAQSYCDGLSLGGKEDWRLPNVKELVSIQDYRVDNPTSSPVFIMPDMDGYPSYWSATSVAANSTNAWAVRVVTGSLIKLDKDGIHLADKVTRCVR